MYELYDHKTGEVLAQSSYGPVIKDLWEQVDKINRAAKQHVDNEGFSTIYIRCYKRAN